MSYNAKNLSYETKEPPFLQKLRNQYGGTSGRLERPIARPRRPKEDNDDDEPTYVDEESNEVISKEEYNALVHGSNQKEDAPSEERAEHEDQEKQHPAASKAEPGDEAEASKQSAPSKQNLAEIGGPKKRKQAKVVGEDNVPEDREEQPEGGESQKPKQQKKKSKEKKKIKLSFDDA